MTVWHLDGRVSLGTQLADRFNDFGNPTTISRMIVTKSTTIGIKGQLSNT
jgi:hypothetical protein